AGDCVDAVAGDGLFAGGECVGGLAERVVTGAGVGEGESVQRDGGSGVVVGDDAVEGVAACQQRVVSVGGDAVAPVRRGGPVTRSGDPLGGNVGGDGVGDGQGGRDRGVVVCGGAFLRPEGEEGP